MRAEVKSADRVPIVVAGVGILALLRPTTFSGSSLVLVGCGSWRTGDGWEGC
jgi:hypothetical protein